MAIADRVSDLNLTQPDSLPENFNWTQRFAFRTHKVASTAHNGPRSVLCVLSSGFFFDIRNIKLPIKIWICGFS